MCPFLAIEVKQQEILKRRADEDARRKREDAEMQKLKLPLPLPTQKVAHQSHFSRSSRTVEKANVDIDVSMV